MKLKSGVPRHSQISQWLRQQIESGEYRPDEKLPSENELAKRFDVSRVTIRRALQSLENDTLIYRCQGLGSFVSDRRTPHNLVRLTDFNEDMSNAGLNASSQVRDFSTEATPLWLSEILEIGENQPVTRIDRLRLGNYEPVAFDSTWLPLVYGQLIDPEGLEETTIYKILEQEYQIPILRGSYRITGAVADDLLADALDIKTGDPLLQIDRTSWTVGEKPVYYQKRYYRSDRVLYEMTLERQPDDAPGALPFKEFVPIFRSSTSGAP